MYAYWISVWECACVCWLKKTMNQWPHCMIVNCIVCYFSRSLRTEWKCIIICVRRQRDIQVCLASYQHSTMWICNVLLTFTVFLLLVVLLGVLCVCACVACLCHTGRKIAQTHNRKSRKRNERKKAQQEFHFFFSCITVRNIRNCESERKWKMTEVLFDIVFCL